MRLLQYFVEILHGCLENDIFLAEESFLVHWDFHRWHDSYAFEQDVAIGIQITGDRELKVDAFGEQNRFVVELSGRVRDKTIIRAESLEVSLRRSEGRIEMVFGDCELAVGDAPDKAKAVAAARSNGHSRKQNPESEQPPQQSDS